MAILSFVFYIFIPANAIKFIICNVHLDVREIWVGSLNEVTHYWSFVMGIRWVSTLHWRHNGRDCISNHQPYDCLLNRLFRRRSKKTPKLRVTGLCEGNSPGTGEFPAQMASNAENVSPFDDVIMNVESIMVSWFYLWCCHQLGRKEAWVDRLNQDFQYRLCHITDYISRLSSDQSSQGQRHILLLIFRQQVTLDGKSILLSSRYK